MISVIIATHGKFSTEILKSAEMIFGNQEQIETVTFVPGEGTEDLINKYNNALAKFDKDSEVLFAVDLFGGSPFNAASNIAASKEYMDIVTGISLPMLLSIFEGRDTMKLDELVSSIKENAVLGIKSLRETLKETSNINDEEEEL